MVWFDHSKSYDNSIIDGGIESSSAVMLACVRDKYRYQTSNSDCMSEFRKVSELSAESSVIGLGLERKWSEEGIDELSSSRSGYYHDISSP